MSNIHKQNQHSKLWWQRSLFSLSIADHLAIPILNFVGHHIEDGRANAEKWKEMFRECGIHNPLFIDAWERDREEERMLYSRLKHFYADEPLKAHFIKYYQDEQEKRVPDWLKGGADIIAETLIDCAAFGIKKHLTPKEKRKQLEAEIQIRVQNKVEEVWKHQTRVLIELMTPPGVEPPKFVASAAKEMEAQQVHRNPLENISSRVSTKLLKLIPSHNRILTSVLFSNAALAKYGGKVLKGAAIGATAGAVIDFSTGGASLGGGMMMGATMGGMLGAAYVKTTEVYFNKHDLSLSAYLSAVSIANLVGMMVATLDHLYRRGAANEEPIRLNKLRDIDRQALSKLTELIMHEKIYRNKSWSRVQDDDAELFKPNYKEPQSRQNFREKLTEEIINIIQGMKGIRS